MSCIGFFTPEQLRRVREAAADPRPVSSFASPPARTSALDRLRRLAGSSDERIRQSAALSPAAPDDVLVALAADPSRSVRCCVARNPRAGPDVLGRLADDLDAGVRGWVAANPGTGSVVLDRLADDPDPTVRSVVAWSARWPGPG